MLNAVLEAEEALRSKITGAEAGTSTGRQAAGRSAGNSKTQIRTSAAPLVGQAKSVGKALERAVKIVNPCQLPPCVLTKEQLKTCIERAGALVTHGRLPTGVTSIQFWLWFSTPTWLKTSEHIVMFGPYLKYLLQGCLDLTTQAVLFRYIDAVNALWSYSIRRSDVPKLKLDLVRALADMELHMPAWELDINRHNILHLVDQIQVHDTPLWVLSAFPSERLWYKLTGYVESYVPNEL
jgi:hypothetical protein